jgi:hypothetical protein
LHGDERHVCPRPGATLELLMGMRWTPVDFVLPIREVRCPFCHEWVLVEQYSMMEALWMHEYECRAIALAV